MLLSQPYMLYLGLVIDTHKTTKRILWLKSFVCLC